MLALFSNFVRWLKRDSVRALENPVRKPETKLWPAPAHPDRQWYLATGHAMFPATDEDPPPAGYVRIPKMYSFDDGTFQDAFAREDGTRMPFVLPARSSIGLAINLEWAETSVRPETEKH